MKTIIIKKENIKNEFELQISAREKIINIENNKIRCNIQEKDGKFVLKFSDHYNFTFAKKCNGFFITEAEAKNIAKLRKEVIAEEQQKEMEIFLNKNVFYHCSYNFFLPTSMKKFKASTIRIVRDMLVKNEAIKKLTGFGDYDTTETYEIKNSELIKMLEEVEAGEVEKEEIKEMEEIQKEMGIFAMAKASGEKQLLRSWSEECDDKNEDCDIDNIYVYALPNGKTEQVRHHTW